MHHRRDSSPRVFHDAPPGLRRSARFKSTPSAPRPHFSASLVRESQGPRTARRGPPRAWGVRSLPSRIRRRPTAGPLAPRRNPGSPRPRVLRHARRRAPPTGSRRRSAACVIAVESRRHGSAHATRSTLGGGRPRICRDPGVAIGAALRRLAARPPSSDRFRSREPSTAGDNEMRREERIGHDDLVEIDDGFRRGAVPVTSPRRRRAHHLEECPRGG